MKYLIPMFDCCAWANKVFHLKKGVKYVVNGEDNQPVMIVGCNSELPYMFDMHDNSNVLKIKHKQDEFYFLKPFKCCETFSTSIKFKNHIIKICLASRLQVFCDEELKSENFVENLNYSHYEIHNNVCLIHFSGKRNYVVVINNDEVSFSNYYDECNIKENEKYFMCKLNDSLNHGKVCEIKDGEVASYLVYLDNEELKLKSEFVSHVFLDCVKAGNLNYANQLLHDDIKLKDEKMLVGFLPSFEDYYPINSTTFILENKNALAGIVEFEIQDKLITNLILH